MKVDSNSFETCGVSKELHKTINKKGYTIPTPFQMKILPLIFQGYDIVGLASTGSGKTAAFVLPLIDKLKKHSKGPRSLVLSPTRELSLQTHKLFCEMTKNTELLFICLIGGESLEKQNYYICRSPDIIIASPGRLIQYNKETQEFNLDKIRYVVLDEADRLLEMGFVEQIKTILSHIPNDRQMLLFSATMQSKLIKFINSNFKIEKYVCSDNDAKLSPNLNLFHLYVNKYNKSATLLYIIHELLSKIQKTIVFVATKHHAEFLQTLLTADSIKCNNVHGSMNQTTRKINLSRFRSGKISLLIVTDCAAYGIDIPLLDNIINYDFPYRINLFILRAGRVARSGRRGRCFSLISREEISFMLDIQLYLSKPLLPINLFQDSNFKVQQFLKIVPPSGEKFIFGHLSTSTIENTLEHYQHLLSSSDYLKSKLLPCSDAYKLYRKTLPNASKVSLGLSRLLFK
jgi:ATP-dependent RNA helicase DDX54/DBP10